ncbi:MAG TPA: aminoglycoside phosphotransferase family protein [Mycobacteriales bacterium]|nr:aminoglycoside phosphotransferase family protein [Mycobacteriales bacterium]
MPDPERPDGRGGIDADLVRRLIAAQFPQWADLPVQPVPNEGWDNRTYHLGDGMTVRLPSAEGYAAAVEKEQRWLPILASYLPLPIPVPLGMGEPTEEYPYHWTVNRWLDGQAASRETIADLNLFATDLGEFLTALQGIDVMGGPVAGRHSFYRGASLMHYDEETRRSIEILGDRIDGALATEIWETALAATWTGAPVWFHGDVAVGNLLVRDGRLSAVIDFGTSGVGDPACDLVIAWTLFTEESRKAFGAALAADEGTWARGRGWALWKDLIGLADEFRPSPVLEQLFADHTSVRSSG